MGWLDWTLILALCAMIYLYFGAIKKMNSAVNFLLLILLIEENYRLHRDLVAAAAKEPTATSAVSLGMIVTTILRRRIFESDSNKTFLAASDRLWLLRTGAPQEKA